MKLFPNAKTRCRIVKVTQKPASSGTFKDRSGKDVAWAKGPHQILIAIVEAVEALDSKTFFPHQVPLKLIDFENRPLKINQNVELQLFPLEKESSTEYLVLPDSLTSIYSIAYEGPSDVEVEAPSTVPASSSAAAPASSRK